MLIPYQIDVPTERLPVTNWAIIALTTAVFFLQIISPEETFEPYYLTDWSSPLGWIGSVWLHGDILHWFGNMFFLWVFGNAVCAKVGNEFYLLYYLLFHFFGNACFLLFSSGPMIGASGAINGVIGMYLMFYPLNSIDCLFILFFPFVRAFTISGFWLILLWFGFDLYGVIGDDGAIAYWAHIGGFLSGFGLAYWLLSCGHLAMKDYEKSVLQIWKKEVKVEPMDPVSPERAVPGHVDENGWVHLPPPIEPQQTEISKTEPPKNLFVRLRCDCGSVFKVAIEHAGKTSRCPRCKARLHIPLK
jgi:membrane associated rhomboid family serine protease